MKTSKQVLGLIAWLAATLATGAIGSIASINAPEFYAQLTQPEWSPPSSVFGPVWTALYVLMGIAAWLVWRERGFAGARVALSWFIVQLVFNALWSWLFFAWRLGAASAFEILMLWALILATLISFWRQNRVAGLLLLPYLAWVSFASALNWTLWRMNPQLLGSFPF